MSGMYNVVFGSPDPSVSAFLLMAAGFDPAGEPPARFRDVWVEGEGDELVIRVHTRIGGGNRDEYADQWDEYRAMPTFLRDADDDYDSTYADLYFRPDVEPLITRIIEVTGPSDREELRRQFEAVLVQLAKPHVDMGARWQEAIDQLGKQPTGQRRRDGA